MNPSISIVLPNYNGVNLLKKNLPSLIEAIEVFEHEIIIVDDCSSDESVSFLNNTYPRIKVIKNEVNLGFSSTCNRGIRASRLELLCVANTDVTFTPNYFLDIIDNFNDKSIFAVKGDIINYKKSFEDIISIDRTGHLYYKRGFLRISSNKPLTVKTLITKNNKNFVCLGCCFVSDREKMIQLDGFDEIYSPFYWEDCDLGRRALEKGFKLLYLPEAKVFHQASSTIGNYRSNNLRRLISNRNKFLFTWHHLGKKRLWLFHAPTVAINLLTRWIILDWRYYTCLYMAISRKLTFIR